MRLHENQAARQPGRASGRSWAAAFAFCALAIVAFTAAVTLAQRPQNAYFQRVSWPGDEPFSFLVPEGWRWEGGPIAAAPESAVDRSALLGPGGSLDLTVGGEEAGPVSLRRFADRVHGGAGEPVPTAAGYLVDTLLRETRPAARNVRVRERREAPALASACAHALFPGGLAAGTSAAAAVVTVEYDEDGTPFRERLAGVVIGGPVGWASAWTASVRAPAAEFARWEPTFSLILATVKPEGAGGAQALRAALDLQLPRANSWENPFTGEAEAGAFCFGRYRWVTPDGDVAYSSNETFNPSAGSALNRTDWSKSKPLEPR